MLEEFIAVALEAFSNANGDIDKFELQLRRKLMVYNTTVAVQQPIANTTIPAIPLSQVEKAITNISENDPIFAELENIDVNTMTDEDVLALARRMGIMEGVDEQSEEDE
jgi:hypothetical protein